jgi:hypothetical protein
VVRADVLQIHVLVHPLLATGSLDGHRTPVVLAQEAVSNAITGAVRRDLPSTWRHTWGFKEKELWRETEALGYVDKTGRPPKQSNR